MSKFKLKDKTDPKGVATYRVDGTDEPKGFRKVVLGDANQKQFADLHSIEHPFVVEDKGLGSK